MNNGQTTITLDINNMEYKYMEKLFNIYIYDLHIRINLKISRFCPIYFSVTLRTSKNALNDKILSKAK